ncbi:LOW QUALITY PROTEIN: hypothetical protein Cgig2_006221 [Carnegiea gigantea]|uniref:Cytochrome P450 n=1 Tax=Carnegiea gigantea TaxID=171969 RepID=A0A9Q1QSY2_9CARY|nr:LOW QUALITY PROTEIN: hypothetical protein Cgig2_006221 [Carnegiea gigantea]
MSPQTLSLITSHSPSRSTGSHIPPRDHPFDDQPIHSARKLQRSIDERLDKRFMCSFLSISGCICFGFLLSLTNICQACKLRLTWVCGFEMQSLLFLTVDVGNAGKDFFMWFGPIPVVNISKPEFLREALTKMEEFQMAKFNPVIDKLFPGFINYDGEQWAQHQRVVNPAFHMEKLKVILFSAATHLSAPPPGLNKPVLSNVLS